MTFLEFIEAIENIDNIDNKYCYDYALQRFGMKKIKEDYLKYFAFVQTVLSGKGFYDGI